MAELLVRRVDKINTDSPYLDAQCTKRGFVIAVCPDGWPWGGDERGDSAWVILKVPDMSESEAGMFLAPERDDDPGQPSRVLQRRAFKLDLDALPEAPSAEDLRKAKTPVSPLSDPVIFGEPSNVIG